ncbi:MAG: transglycosylase SLT domain-containing protein, partial [Polaromonas sp.]|nr:transglycosylase SLT domain-containing protein [Polaromonas sp.]
KEASDADLKKAHIKYYGVSADAMTTKANAAADKVLMTVDKFEPSDQAAIKTLNEQQSIDYTAMSKGLADGSMTVTSPNYLVLKERYDIRGAQSQKIYKKYAAPASAPEMSDFNKGFYPSPPAGAPAPAAAPASAVKGRTGNPMFDAIVQTESNGNPNAVSPKGAKGLMQVMPGTNSDPGFGVTPARDNSEGERTRVGQDYFTKMQTRYNGNDALAAIAYNWGPGNTDTWLKNGGDYKKLPAETQSYVSQVLTRSGVNNQSRSGAPAAVTPAAARPAIASLTATAQDDSTPGGVTPTAGSASDSPGTGIGATPSEPRAQVVTAAGGVTPNSKTIKPATPPSRSASGAITSPADATEMTANDARLAKRTINYTGLIDEVAPTRGKAGGYSYKGKIYPTKQAAIDALYNS